MGLEHCFGCGTRNPIGLHLVFGRVDRLRASATGLAQPDMAVEAEFVSEVKHQGWPGIQHGGITGALLDEAAGYVPYFLGEIAMTAAMDVSYLQPIRTGETVWVGAQLLRRSRRLLEVSAQISDGEGVCRAHATAKLMILTPRQREQIGLADVPAQSGAGMMSDHSDAEADDGERQ
jgi:uncharacterized protein (TIGR00369 family)